MKRKLGKINISSNLEKLTASKKAIYLISLEKGGNPSKTPKRQYPRQPLNTEELQSSASQY